MIKEILDQFGNETQNLFSDSFGSKNPILDFLEEKPFASIDRCKGQKVEALKTSIMQY